MPAETHSHRQPLDRDAIAELVCEQLAEILGVDPDVVTLDARVREDLDADDFALIDLAEAVEAELGERSVGLTIDDDDLVELRTVRDAVDCLVSQMEADRSGPRRDR
jgi:acyl carrier protein